MRPQLQLAAGACGDPTLDRRWTARRLALDVAAVEAVAALDSARIPSILLKGPVTATRLYPGEFRPYLDIDLIVPPAAHLAAGQVLAGLGYRLVDSAPSAASFRRPADGCTIDLHRTLRRVGVDPDAVWRVLAAHRVPFRLHRATVGALDDAGLAFHLALHVVQSGALKPKPGQDLARALERLPAGAWATAAAIAAELDAVGALVAALRCGSADGDRLADRLGLPWHVPLVRQVHLRQPVRGLGSLASLSRDNAVATLRRWLLPSAAERAHRLSLPDARGLLPGASPAARYVALRLEQVVEMAMGVSIEAGRRAWAAARGFARLPPRERLLLVRYLLMVVGLEVALRCTTPSRLVPAWAATARWAPARGRRAVSWRRRERLVARAAAAVRPGRTCLPEALLLWREALAAGDGARLVIGVRTAPTFRAHAWVERLDGSVLGAGEPVAGMARLAVWGPDGVLSPGRGG